MRIRQVARPYMQELANYAGASVSLGSRDRLNLIYVEHCRSRGAVMLRLDMGSRIQIGTSAMGRAYLTAVSESERADILERVRELTVEERWPELKAGVEQALLDINELGVCCSFGEWQKDVNAIAIPVRPGGGLPPMCINCGAPAYIVSREFLLNEVRPRLIALARDLETSLGTASESS